jgi:beta-lactamase regulating signal transducer with metallopeptidase domain
MMATLAVVTGQGVSGLVVSWLGQALLLGTILAGLTWLLVKLVDRQSHPDVIAVLWSVVLLKFLIPIGPAASFSLGSLWEQCCSYVAGAPSADVMAFLGGPDAAGPTDASSPAAPTTRMQQGWSWATYVAFAYAVLLVHAVVIRGRNYRAFLARCRNLPQGDEAIQMVVHRVCQRLGVRRVPSVRVSSEFRAPFVIGLIRPMIVLSHRQLARPAELETVIVHEVTHLRRGDMFVRYLQWIAGTLLFFWPVVAWVNRRIDEARECACDVWALRHGSLSPGEYARCLLSAVQPVQVRRCLYHPACMAASPTMIERRIDMILDLPSRERKRPVWGLLMASLVIAWGAFALAGPIGAHKTVDPMADDGVVTDEELKVYLGDVISHMREFPSVDINEDGELDRIERNAFIIVATKHLGNSVVVENYPYADQNGDGGLSFEEAYEFARGHILLMKTKKQFGKIFEEEKANGTLTKEREEELKKEIHLANNAIYIDVLDMYDWVIDQVSEEPAPEEIKTVYGLILEHEAKMGAKQKSAEKKMLKADQMKTEAEFLLQKAADMRLKADETDDPDLAEKLRTRADKMEAKADELRAMLEEEK